MPVGKVRQYPYFVRLFHTSTPLISVELRMKKESRDLVASTGHLCLYNLDLLSSKRRGAYFMVFSDSFASLFSVHGQLISSSDCLIFLM